MPRAVAIVLIAVLVGGVSMVPAGGQGKGGRQVARKKPPYKLGPSGGDEFNEIERDRDNGRITIVRGSPDSGGFGCPDSRAGWGMFKVTQKLKRRLRHVAVRYEQYEGDG